MVRLQFYKYYCVQWVCNESISVVIMTSCSATLSKVVVVIGSRLLLVQLSLLL